MSKGESLKDTALTLEAMGADAVVVRHSASGAPHRLAHSGWVRSNVINAGDGTHEHPTQALLDAFTMTRHLGAPRRPPDRARRRRPAQPGGPLQRAAAAHARRRGHPGRAADAVPGRHRGLAGGDVVRPGRGAAQGRRGDDAARPAGADERRVLPDRPGVLPPLRPRRQADGDAPGPHDRHAPRPDGPRHGDHGRRGRLRPLRDRRAGHQRRRRADGRPVPAARAAPSRPSEEKSEHHLPDQERRDPRR